MKTKRSGTWQTSTRAELPRDAAPEEKRLTRKTSLPTFGSGSIKQERREIRLSLAELEQRAGITLPESSRMHQAHWYSYQGSAVARAIIDAGWHASRVDLTEGTLSLVPGPSPGRR